MLTPPFERPGVGGGCDPVANTMTRAALLAARNGGTLSKGCHYWITDYSRGTVGAATIMLHAVEQDMLSRTASVETSFDNTSWKGEYDIDTNRITLLHDNIGNEVSGEASVDAFPWGNAAVYDNKVVHASFVYSGGSVYGNEFKNNSNTTVASGNFRNNVVQTDANVTINSGNVQRNSFGAQSNTTITSADFLENKVKEDATVTITTTGDVDNNEFGALCAVTISAGNFDFSIVETDANVNQTGGNVLGCEIKQQGNLIISGGNFYECSIEQDAQVTITSGTNQENVFGATCVYNQVGTGYIRYSEIRGSTTITNGNTTISNSFFNVATVNTTGSTGYINNTNLNRAFVNCLNNQTFISDSHLGAGMQIQANDAERLYLYRCSILGGSRVLVSADARLDASYSSMDSYAYWQATGGFLRVNYSRAENLGYIRNLTTNTNYVDRSLASSQSNIRFEGTANNCRVYYSVALAGASIYMSGSSANCYIYYCLADSLGQIRCTDSVNARIYYNSATGYSEIRSVGNTTTHYIYYSSAQARGFIDMFNNTGTVRIYACRASAQSILRVQNSTAGNLYYSSFDAYYYLLATLTTGTRSGLHGYGRRSYTVTNPPNGTFTQNF